MCKVITVSNQKGGTAKTTSCVNLGIGLASAGKKVLLIDTDPQGSLSISLGYSEPDEMENTLATLMMNIVNDEEFCLEDVLIHHEEGVDILPSNIELSAIEVSLVNVMSRELILRQLVDRVRDTYDFIIIDCIYYGSCLRRNLCDTESKYSCFGRCKCCTEYDCKKLCNSYVSSHCSLLDKPPYVCTCCSEEKTCKRNHAYYTAHRANAEYTKLLSSSRKGLRTAPDKLLEINDLIAPLIYNGQSINHIFASHAKEIGLSERTIYNYIDMNAFDVKNMDLPKKTRYRQRHPQKVLTKIEYQCRKGRTLEDFKSYVEQNPNLPVVEMDTVKGARHSGQCLLTMIFRENNFMLIFLLPDGTQKSVLAVFDKLTLLLGLETFRKLFPVILTDNGVEFKGAHNLEFTENGARRTRIFYCDPQASWQKAQVEKNHVLIRRILPKGATFKFLSDENIHLITCHINSVSRELFDNRTPFDLMSKEEHKKLLDILALSPVPPDEVCLKPALLKRN